MTPPDSIQHPLDASAFESVALVLQGGGALGAYQCGVYEALAEINVCPNWVAGISIGAINGAIIAGNAPGDRVARLREFWELVTSSRSLSWVEQFASAAIRGDFAREIYGQVSAGTAMTNGAPGFFAPRMPPPWLEPNGTIEATSFYDTAPLRATLERLVDFDRINRGETRLSVGAVNVETGNFVYFDTTQQKIGPEHIMASGALPPGLPAIEIDGQHYWDGGVVSNTPLQWVIDAPSCQDTLIFQVDLWNARGVFPRSMAEVTTRQKEITYSSRTRAQTDRIKEEQKLRQALARVLKQLPPDVELEAADREILQEAAKQSVYNIVQLIYRAQNYEGQCKDYDFSPLAMEEHWKRGLGDAKRTLRHPQIFERPTSIDGVATFDLTRDTAL